MEKQPENVDFSEFNDIFLAITIMDKIFVKHIKWYLKLELDQEIAEFEDRIRNDHHVRLLYGLDFNKNSIRI